MIAKKFLDLSDLIKAQVLYIHKLTEIVIIA